MSTQEFAASLRHLLLFLKFTHAQIANVGAHSLKTTCLSWLAKAGVEKELRRVLGYHLRPGDRTMESYSRDAIGGPLRQLDKVILMIKKGEFEPDNTRSGRFTDKPASESSSSATASSSEEGTEDGKPARSPPSRLR